MGDRATIFINRKVIIVMEGIKGAGEGDHGVKGDIRNKTINRR